VHRSPALACQECQEFADRRFGAGGWGRSGPVLADDGTVEIHGPTELVSLGMRDIDGRDLGVRVVEEPNPEAGQPVTFVRGYAHHDGYGACRPAHRREGLPDGLLLTGVERPILAVLDHWHKARPFPGEPVRHLRAVGAVGPGWQWLRDVAGLAEEFVPEYGQRRNRRPWVLVRRAAARHIIATILGEPEGRIHRRIKNHESKRRGAV
jgi:hypothetical protein